MLDRLPSSQRQAALDAIGDLESQAQAASGLQQSINEPIKESDSIGINSTASAPASTDSVAMSRSRLVINFEPRLDLEAEEQLRLENDPALMRLVGSHLFVLDESGVLSLQGLDLIPLLGLTEADINRRLAAEPFLSSFSISAKILGQKPIGAEALRPFSPRRLIENNSVMKASCTTQLA